MAEMAFSGHHLANQLVCNTSIPSFLDQFTLVLQVFRNTGADRYYFFEVVPLLSRQNHLEGIAVSV